MRRAELEALIEPDGSLMFSEALEDDGALVFEKACELGALDILRAQEALRDRKPHVFPGARPRQPLSHMGMSLLLRRKGVDATVHGMRMVSQSRRARLHARADCSRRNVR